MAKRYVDNRRNVEKPVKKGKTGKPETGDEGALFLRRAVFFFFPLFVSPALPALLPHAAVCRSTVSASKQRVGLGP